MVGCSGLEAGGSSSMGCSFDDEIWSRTNAIHCCRLATRTAATGCKIVPSAMSTTANEDVHEEGSRINSNSSSSSSSVVVVVVEEEEEDEDEEESGDEERRGREEAEEEEEQGRGEVSGDELSTTLSPSSSATSTSAGDCPYHGLVSYIGRRKDMEDAVCAVPDFFSLPCDLSSHSGDLSSFHFFGVYDGHGGAQAANFCRNRFHVALAEQMSASISENVGANGATNWDRIWERAMVSCFLKLDGEIEGRCGRCERCRVGPGPCSNPVAPESVGSTAVVAVVGSTRIVVANCGDSRVVLCRGGRAIPLSVDHKPERPDEMERIEALGGRVIFWNGYRVMGMLAMSRALGDRYLKPYVIPTPDVECFQRTEQDEFLVLASDGLWDVLSTEQVCDITRLCLAGRCNRTVLDGGLAGQVHGTENAQARLAAAYLTKFAYSRRSSDNISVVVVDLKNRQASGRRSSPSPSPCPDAGPSPVRE